MKMCKKCLQQKSLEDFNKKSKYPDGLYIYCIICQRLENKKTYEKQKIKRQNKSKQYYYDNKEIILKKISENSEERNSKAREYYKNNRDSQIKKMKVWRKENEEYSKQYRKQYNVENRLANNEAYNKWLKSSPTAKIARSCRNRLAEILKLKGLPKNKRFLEYVGCTKDELKLHLESKFQPGMNWENYGQWHIDHIKALCHAKTEEEVYQLCHYTNLQPLWALDNLKKNKY